MSRSIAASTPAAALWGSVETAVRLTICSLRAPAASDQVLAALEAEQSRIRRSARHWLVG